MTALVLIRALIGGATGAAMRGHANDSGSPAGALEPERPITLQQRATVAATVETLAPTLSMNGRVAGRHHLAHVPELWLRRRRLTVLIWRHVVGGIISQPQRRTA